MSTPDLARATEIRRVILEFLSARLNDQLKKVEKDDVTSAETKAKKEVDLRQRFDFVVWINDAAQRVNGLEMVTHSLKAVHPAAKGSRGLYCPPRELPAHGLLGSHSLGQKFDDDVVGTASALDVYQFLKLSVGGRTLLDLMLTGDSDLLAALSDDADEAHALVEAFASITQPRGTPSSHTLAKQIYWLADSDHHQDEKYHLLAPLFPTSLTHRVYQTIQHDRFSEESSEARKARKEKRFTDYILHDYPDMAVQKLGGAQPQNISSLNSARRGTNYLLASLPPRWKSEDLKPLLNAASMFQRFERRPEVKREIRALRAFLRTDPPENAETRSRRDALVEHLAGELLTFRAELCTLPAGWSQLPTCRLSAAERQWLDPDGMALDDESSAQASPMNSTEQISQAFGRWLNQKLRDPLPMGDSEYLHWTGVMQAELDAEERAANDVR